MGVKTTGIFCLPTCRARKPKFENVEFFTEVSDLLQNRYRPCKICRPTQIALSTPEEVLRAIDLVHQSPKEKISDAILKHNGLKPEKIRRWFQKQDGITFQAYQRMLRINQAFNELKKGAAVTNTAYDTGYESLIGFGYTFKRLVGKSPEEAKNQKVILIHRFSTPLGPMFVCSTDQGICLLEFTSRRMLETEFRDLQKRLNGVIFVGENQHTEQLKKELKEYFEGKRKHFSIALDSPGTPFQQSVWKMLQTIPYGQTRSYQQQAKLIGNPKAIRAVASANGHNRIAIVIPCHRVIGKDGKLVGYAGGLDRKKWLLEHERKHL